MPRSDTELLISLGALMTAAITIAIAWRLRRGPVAVALTAALGSYLVFAPYVLPWYPAWVIPVIGLAPRVPVTRVLTFQAALLVIVYELKTQDLTTQLANIVWWIAVIASVTLCVLFLRSLRRVPAANRELSAVGAR
ncbi:MAG: hypothetical protein ACXVJA_08705 [Acidimicrobiia bacterium]